MQLEFYERYINGAPIADKIIFDTDIDRFKYIPNGHSNYLTKDLFSHVVNTLNSQLPLVASYKDLYLEYSYDKKTKYETYTVKKHKKSKTLLTSLSICESDILVVGETNLWIPMTDKMKDLVLQLQNEIDLFRKQNET